MGSIGKWSAVRKSFVSEGRKAFFCPNLFCFQYGAAKCRVGVGVEIRDSARFSTALRGDFAGLTSQQVSGI
jgi:hypothetical protein